MDDEQLFRGGGGDRVTALSATDSEVDEDDTQTNTGSPAALGDGWDGQPANREDGVGQPYRLVADQCKTCFHFICDQEILPIQPNIMIFLYMKHIISHSINRCNSKNAFSDKYIRRGTIT